MGTWNNTLNDIILSLNNAPAMGMGTGQKAYQAILALYPVPIYSNLNVLCSHSHCQCEHFSVILFSVPVMFKLCLNKP